MGRVVKARDLHVRPGRIGACDPIEQDREELSSLAKMLEANERRVIDLALVMAEKLVEDAVCRDPSSLEKIYVEAVEKLGGYGANVIMRINPLDASSVGLEKIRSLRDLEIVEDEKVMRFSCTVEANGVRVEHGIAPLVDQLIRSTGGESHE